MLITAILSNAVSRNYKKKSIYMMKIRGRLKPVLIKENIMKHIKVNLIITISLISFNAVAGVYKCTDIQGNTSYQSSPCAEEKQALKIDMKTGGATNLTLAEKQKKAQLAAEQANKEQQEALKKLNEKKEAKRLKDSAEQSALNQQLIKDNPVQFSAFAIPPYLPDQLTPLVKLHEARLPEIEKFRRLAAQKALKTGECKRVESDQLSIRSKPDQLVISIDCSSAKTFYYSESELISSAE